MKIITREKAKERLDNNRVVCASFDTEYGTEFERLLLASDVDRFYEDAEVHFGYDEIAEAEAEQIFASLRDEVKDYLYLLLLSENSIA